MASRTQSRCGGEVFETGHAYEDKQRLRRFDGVYPLVRCTRLLLRDPDRRILNWYVLLTEIDDRQRAVKALLASAGNPNLIINTIPALAWLARPDGSADFFNQHYLDYMGLSPLRG
jgi:PAS domain-containing protein